MKTTTTFFLTTLFLLFSNTIFCNPITNAQVPKTGNASETALSDYRNFTVIDDFNDGVDMWWQPDFSATTIGIIIEDDEGNPLTYRAQETNIVNPHTGSTGSMKLAFVWDDDIEWIEPAPNGTHSHFIRVFFPTVYSMEPERRFEPGQALEVFIYGDGSGNRMRLMVRDGILQLEGSPWQIIDWTGWRRFTWDYNDVANVIGWVTGNGEMTEGEPFFFNSFQVTRNEAGTTTEGVLFLDDLRIVDPFTVAFDIIEADGTEVISINDIQYQAGITDFGLFPGDYQFSVEKPGYQIYSGSFVVDHTGLNIEVVLTPSDDEQMPGDANCDGAVNVMDLITMANYFTGDDPDPFCFENADVNGDDAINVIDIILTIEIFLGDLNTYHLQLDTSPGDAGTVTGTGEYHEGEHVSIAAEAASGWEFVNWTGDTDFIDNAEEASTMVTMPAQDIHLTANFTAVEPEPPLLTVMVYCDLSHNPIEGALVEFWSYNFIEYSGLTDENGQVVFFNIPPGQCGGFIYKEEYHWYDLDFEMEDHDKHIAARLVPLPFELLLSAHPAEGGTVEGSGIYSYGQEVIISATEAANWEFVHWTGDTQYLHDDVNAPVNTITMPGTDIGLEALFYSTVFPTVDLIMINNTQPGVMFAEAVVIKDPDDYEAVRGFVWGTEEYPDLEHNEGLSVDQGTGTGTFFKDITDLTPNIHYFIRAYATNDGGTAYSEQFDFNFWDYHGTITDIDGNVYNTIVIGDQEWMAENLKTTRYRNGAAIAHPVDNTEWENNTGGAYAWFEYEVNWKDSYGALYNWHAVNNTNGLCPTGWHVPSDAEWTQLSDHIGGGGVGKKLKTCLQVDSPWGGECDTSEHPRWDAHNTQYGVNEYGFSALPGGHRWPYGPFGHLGSRGRWWSSTEKYATSARYRWMIYESGAFFPSSNNKNYGYSVRCVRNVGAH